MARRFRRSVLTPLAALLAAVTLSACGGSGGGDADAGDAGAFPVSLSISGRTVTIPERPARIVSLSPTATEVLFAIGAGDQVVAVDSASNHPPQAPVTGLQAFQPNVEEVAAFDPDLVVLSYDPGEIVAGLVALGIPTILHDAPDSLAGAYTQIEQLGAATGRVGDAAEVVAGIRTDLAGLAASIGRPTAPITYYYELDDTYFSVTSKTFIGDALAQVGLSSIADAAGATSPYPQLTAEHIFATNPDLILLADVDCCGQSAATVSARPGWSSLTAVRTGTIVALGDDVASRWGPRVVDLARSVADAARIAVAAKR